MTVTRIGRGEKVEAAFTLIKLHDPIQYNGICRHLKRIWVIVIALLKPGLTMQASMFASSIRSMSCQTLFRLRRSLRTIVHEATHARLEHRGIRYEETRRSSIERICIGRELALLKRLPNCAKLSNEAEYKRQYFRF